MSFFSCDISRDELERQNPELPLYPGKVNQWIVALNAAPTPESVKFAIGEMFRVTPGLGTVGFTPPVRDLALQAWQVGPPASLNGSLAVLKGYPHDALPKERIYAGVRFLYMGLETALSPWPWHSRGFVIQCPEDVIGGVLAVMPPFDPPPEPESAGPLDRITAPFGKAADALSTATKVLLWGGAAVLLFNVYQWTKSPRHA